MSSPFHKKGLSPSGRLATLAGDTSRRIQQSIRKPSRLLLSPKANENVNVDTIIRSLYDSEASNQEFDSNHADNFTTQNTLTILSPSSFLPREQPDWILDGREEWNHDAHESRRLLKELCKSNELLSSLLQQESPSLDALQVMEILQDDEQDDGEDEPSFSSSPLDAEEDSLDAEFGDFQSAPGQALVKKDRCTHSEDNECGSSTVAHEDYIMPSAVDASDIKTTLSTETQQDVSPEGAVSTSTNDLLECVDALLLHSDHNALSSPTFQQLTGSPDTSYLVDQSDCMLYQARLDRQRRYNTKDSPHEEKKQDPSLDGNPFIINGRKEFVGSAIESVVCIVNDMDRLGNHSHRGDATGNLMDEAHDDETPSSAKPMNEIQVPLGIAPIQHPAPVSLSTYTTPRNSLKPLWDEVDGGNTMPGPLSLELPLPDLASPEARFIRRRQMVRGNQIQQSASQRWNGESIYKLIPTNELDLPFYFFEEPDSNSVIRLLESLPWTFLDEPVDATQVAAWEECMVSNLSKFDGALEQINAHILHDIQPHESSVEDLNKLVYDLEQNLRLSVLYADRSRHAIDLAWGDAETGAGLALHSVLGHWWEERGSLEELDTLLRELDRIFIHEQALNERIENFNTRDSDALHEYQSVTELSCKLRATVDDERFARLSCLAELKSRLLTTRIRFRNRFRSLTMSHVIRCCRDKEIDWLQYERLLQAAFDCCSSGDDDGLSLAEDWSTSIAHALHMESRRALAMALLRPAGAGSTVITPEIMQLQIELDHDWEDGAKLRTITHNLVVIRFTLEPGKNYLSRVLCRLLEHLVDILDVHSLFLKFHKSTEERPRERQYADEIISRGLSDSRDSLLSTCREVILLCLDEYLQFADKSKLFLVGESGTWIDDTGWWQDLSSLHECLCLLRRLEALEGIIPVGSAVAAEAPPRNSHCLYEKLTDLFQQHLKLVHFEAMTSMGRMLASENWMLSNLALGDSVHEKYDFNQSATPTLRHALEEACLPAVSLRNADCLPSVSDHSLRAPAGTNPFRTEVDEMESRTTSEKVDNNRRRSAGEVLPLMTCALQLHEAASPSTASQSVTHALVAWCGRLLTISEFLPSIANEVARVAVDLFDLYFTTIFRIICCSAENESVLIGAKAPSDFLFPKYETKVTSESPLLYSFRKSAPDALSSPPRRTSTAKISSQVEAEICSPLLSDKLSVEQLKSFIDRAHGSLQESVDLGKVDKWLAYPKHRDRPIDELSCRVAQTLERRVCALWSCNVIAALTDAFDCLMKERLESSTEGLTGKNERALDSLTDYAKDALLVTPTLVAIGMRYSCVSAVAGGLIVSQILEVGSLWEGSTLTEIPNEYVDELCERCTLLWGYLAISAKLPAPLLDRLWEQLLSAASLSLLEGFARVPVCSTEGRALMTLDLASFFAGTTCDAVMEILESRSLETQSPPSIDVSCFIEHVGTYIKVYYFPADDALKWIEENRERYHLNHSIALLVAAAGHKADARILVDKVKMIYQQHAVNS